MTLKEWLDMKGMTLDEVAKEIGVSRQAVHYWVQGKRCRPEFAEKLEKLTHGEVTYRDLTRGSAA